MAWPASLKASQNQSRITHFGHLKMLHFHLLLHFFWFATNPRLWGKIGTLFYNSQGINNIYEDSRMREGMGDWGLNNMYNTNFCYVYGC